MEAVKLALELLCEDDLETQRDRKVPVAFESFIYLTPGEVWSYTLYCPNAKLKQSLFNIVSV